MARKSTVTAAKRERPKANVFPPIFIEALAYHESGHAVMAVLLDVPMVRVAIGPACNDPEFNGAVELDLTATNGRLEIYKTGLMRVASEASEKLAPNHGLFATMHKTHRHLKPFSRGVRTDRIHGFNAVCQTYYRLRLAQSTALREFKREYRDLAHFLFEVPAISAAVHRLAGVLIDRHELSGHDARTTVLSEGPLSDGGLLAKWNMPVR